MSGHCDFCGIWHSGSCCHPGGATVDALRAENERLRGALDRAARTLRGETGCEDQGQAYDTAQRIIDAALAQGEKPC